MSEAPVQRVLEALEAMGFATRRSGAGWAARCPAHGDRKPSLSVNEGGGGLALLYCHRGCTPEHIVQALGLTMRDLFPEGNGAKPRETRYAVRDAAGSLIATKVRLDLAEGKQMWWERDGRKSLGGLPLKDLPLYGAHLVADWPRDTVIVVTEGEKACDALLSRGIPALGTVTGASGCPGREALEVLRDRDVVLWPDYDAAGSAHMRSVDTALDGIAATVRWIEWGSADGDDAADFPGSNDELRKVVDAAAAPPGTARERQQRRQQTSPPPIDEMKTAGWEVPVPLDEQSVPGFPLDVFAPWLREWVLAEAVATQTPIDLAGMLALSVLSTACAGKLRVRVRPGFEDGLNTFVVVVLPVANRKSAVFRDATRPVIEFERHECERQRDEIGQMAQRKRVLEARLEWLEKQAAKAVDDAEQTVARGDANSVRRELAGVHVPAEPRLVIDDCTPEKLTMMMAEQYGRMAQLSPEGDVFEMMAGRYQGSPNFAVYLKGHAGDMLRVDRAGRPPDFVERPALTLGLTVQPNVIQGLMARSDFRGRGLVGRFLFSVPNSPLGSRLVAAPPVPEEVASLYRQGVAALLALPFGTDSEGNKAANILRFDVDADRVLARFEQELEPRLGKYGDLGWMNDWAGKLPGQVARASALLHSADAAGLIAMPWEIPVSGDCVERAVRLGKYLIGHAQAAYGSMGADLDIGGAEHLLGWIKRTQPATFTKRDAHQRNKGRFPRAEDLGAPLRLLEEHRYIRSVEDETSERRSGRPASPIFKVNPLILDAGAAPHIAQNAQIPQAAPSSEDSEDCVDGPSDVSGASWVMPVRDDVRGTHGRNAPSTWASEHGRRRGAGDA
jgi:hypothetical protein